MSEEYGPNFVTLTDEEGNDIELEYIDALEHNGTTYMAFFPVVEEGEEENEDEYGLIILKSEMWTARRCSPTSSTRTRSTRSTTSSWSR